MTTSATQPQQPQSPQIQGQVTQQGAPAAPSTSGFATGQVQTAPSLPGVPPQYNQQISQQPQPQQPYQGNVVPMQPSIDPSHAAMQQLMQTNAMLTERITQLSQPQQPQQPQQPAPQYQPFQFENTVEVGSQARTDLGNTYDSVMQVAQHAAQQMLAPLLEHINTIGQQTFTANNELSSLDTRFADTQKNIYQASLNAAVPDLNQVINDPTFKQFAGQYIPYANKTVRQMLSEAHQAQDIAGVRNIIDQYKNAMLATQQQPGGNAVPNGMIPNQPPNIPGTPVQPQPVQMYMQPQTMNAQYQQPQPQAGNAALIQQEYNQAKARYEAEKTQDAKAAWDAATAKMFEAGLSVL